MWGWVYLAVFIVTWAAWAGFGQHKGYSGVVKYAGGFIAACLVLVAISLVAPKAGGSSAAVASQESLSEGNKPASMAASHDMGLSPEEFAGRFNVIMAKMRRPHRIGEINVSHDAKVPTFKVMLDPKIGMVGTVTNHNSLKSLIMIGGGDGSTMDGLEVFAVMWGMTKSLSPDLADEQVVKTLTEMMKSGEANEEISARLAGLKYSYRASPEVGILYSAEVP